MQNLISFTTDDETLQIEFVEPVQVKPGVTCYVYNIVGDPDSDLALIDVEPGCRTPLQLILKGKKTLEGYRDGEGYLRVLLFGIITLKYVMKPGKSFSKFVLKFCLMRWTATGTTILRLYERCWPKYEEGRFWNVCK